MPDRLTDRAIVALKPQGDKSLYRFDSEVPGLAVRVYPSGRKVFIFDWREQGRQRRVQIGSFPAWTIGKARAHASKLRLRADAGESVAAVRGSRLVDLAEEWLKLVEVTRRPRTATNYRALLTRCVLPRFGNTDPRALTRTLIEQWHGEVAQRVPVEANRALAVLSCLLSWLERERRLDRNVAKGVKRRPESPRQTYLDAAEIAATHAALEVDHPARPAALALRLALLTGCRIGEALAIAAEQIDAASAVWSKSASSTKQRRAHITPMSKAALAVALELLRVGPPDYREVQKVWERVRKAIGRPDARIHDLRHSRASALARGGASLLQIGRVLGHTLPVTTARYAHLVDKDLVDLVERS